MTKNKKILVNGSEITIFKLATEDYISLIDIAKHKDANQTDTIIQNWLRNRNTIELLGFGNNCIIQILNPSNSKGLKNKLV